jgi:GTP1/Obg family GTP-binding protein
LDDIVQQLTDAAPVVARLVEEAEEQAKIRQQEWAEQIRRREERLQIQRQNEAREQARADLLSVIHQWDEIRRIQDFFRDAVTTVSGLSGEDRSLAMDKLAQARELVGELNPLQALLEWKGPQER